MSQIDIELVRQKVGDRVTELSAMILKKYDADKERKFHVFYVADPAYYKDGARDGEEDKVWKTLLSLSDKRLQVDVIFPPQFGKLHTHVQFVRGRTALAVVGNFDALDEDMRDALGMTLTTAAAASVGYMVNDLIFKDSEFYKE